MTAAIVLIAMLGLVSCMLTTKQQRQEARRKFARWNPVFIALIIIQLAFVLLTSRR
jgi:drug/metabolite transporter superfamily protein YnfA